MAKKKPPVTPETQGGFPTHGDPYEEVEDREEEVEEQESPDPPEPKDPRDEQIQNLQTQLATMSGKLDVLQQELSVSRQPPKDPTPDDFYEKIDERLFQKPDEVLKGLEDRIVSKVTKELNSSYQKDQGEKDFWREFYTAHPDLKQDDDLVKATLQGNMSKLGGMPVSEATATLATLTRERISRYAKTPRQRPQVEGANPPSPPPPKKEESGVVTLSDIIRARRNKRRGVAA